MQTKEGGRKARETMLKRYGKDYYKRLGAVGGRKGRTGGFYANRELARIAGAKGGRISKRGAKKVQVKVIPRAIPKVRRPIGAMPAAPKQSWLDKVLRRI